MADAPKLELLRDSALAMELTGDQCAVLDELITFRDSADCEILVNEGESDSHIHASLCAGGEAPSGPSPESARHVSKCV